MVDFDRLAATAERLIGANGRTVTLLKLNRQADDPARPWRGNPNYPNTGGDGAEIPGVVCAFVSPGGSGFGRTANDGAGTLQQVFEQIGLISADAFDKAVAAAGVTATFEQIDVIRDTGPDGYWKVRERWTLRPAEKRVLYAVGLARN